MATLDDLVADATVTGIDPAGPVTVVACSWHGSAAVTLTFRDSGGAVRERLLYRSDESTFEVSSNRRTWSFDGDGALFRLAAEAQRFRLAHLFDPMLAITTSTIDPLPHQIEAVYGEMLPRLPLRFLLADDPGAGKTIMAGLYIKELMLRGDAARVLVVAPGSLVAQWQDELRDKFDLRFDILTRDDLDATPAKEVLSERDLLIARIDQLARRDDLIDRLCQQDWDLVVVDEAHRMSAHFFGGEVKETKKYRLGQALGGSTRHLLLMTATPHAGKDEDFQLFLALLDADRFEGRSRDGVHTVDASDLMRRMIKEKLLRFDGTPLFPERRAYTVTYPLSPLEERLYAEVTDYVRDQMNRADRLSAEGQGRRGNTVGFALTILQRRLASSPEAIYQSLRRRRARLEQRVVEETQAARRARLGPVPQQERLSAILAEDDVTVDDLVDLDGAEAEDLEAGIVDEASAARTIAELEAEIQTLQQLEEVARRVRQSGTDRKWGELSELLASHGEMFDRGGTRRKLIIFTEHRDTMNYLVDRLRTFLGSRDAVVHISGGTGRDERRALQERFTQDESCLVLVATDAAGEGINLQRAHLLINYDLPWNPNRIEQRFGRVHRIGQEEVCHMWNLVAEETREAQVYLRLLAKIDEQRAAYQGQVFDVLGQAISGRELRELLVEAIRYGDDPEVRARLDQVIDEKIGEGLPRLIAEQALSSEVMAQAQVESIRHRMEEAAARRLQPHYVRSFFVAAFELLGGRMREREPGRYQVSHVPAVLRTRDREVGVGAPLLRSYERVTFDKELTRPRGLPPAELVAPGHPLLNVVIDVVLERYRALFTRGTVFVDDNSTTDIPRVLVMLDHAIADGRPARRGDGLTIVGRRFEFVEIPEEGPPVSAGYAPYLDYRPATDAERELLGPVLDRSWLTDDLEAMGRDHAIEVSVPEHLAEVRVHTQFRVERTRAAVKDRLTREINYWDHRANELRLQADAGRQPRMNPERAAQRADELARRLEQRMRTLAQEATLQALPPVVVGGALVVPAALLARLGDGGPVGPLPPTSAEGRAAVDRRAMAAVLAVEDRLDRDARDMNDIRRNHPGYDIQTVDRDGNLWFVEVKGRIRGSETVTVSRNEILTGLNQPDRFILALVEVSPDGAHDDRVRYVTRPFAGSAEPQFAETSRTFDWRKLWAVGVDPLAPGRAGPGCA